MPRDRARWGIVAIAIGGLLGSGGLLREARAADPDPAATAIADGLESFSDAASGLAGLEELANPVPFASGLLPTGDDGLRLGNVFVQSLKDKLAAKTFTSIAELDAFLDDPDGANGAGDDGTYSGVTVDVNGAITQPSAGIHAIALTVSLHRDGTRALDLATPDVDVKGGSLATDFDLTTSLSFRLDTAGAAPDNFYLVTTTPPTMTVGFDAAAEFTGASSFKVDLGLTEATVGGTADIGADFSVALLDPTTDGRITQDDWASTASLDLFEVNYTGSRANLDLTLKSDIAGLEGVTGTVKLSDPDLSNGLDTAPAVSLGALEGFTNMSALDFLAGFASVAGALNGLQTGGPASIDLPFLQQELGELLPVNKKLQDFLVANKLSHASTPLTLGPGPVSQVPSDIDTAEEYDAVLESFDTVQEVSAALASALGVPKSSLGVAYSTAGERLSLNLAFGQVLPAVDADIDFAGELERAGIIDVENLLSAVKVSPKYDLDFGVSVDLSVPEANQTLLHLFALETAGDEMTADAPVAADINVGGKIGFLGVGLKDSNTAAEGTVPIAARKNAANPMLKVNIDGGSDNLLPVGDLLTVLASPNFTAAGVGTISPTVNVAVPSFDLLAAAGASGTTLATGTITVAWSDITAGHPSVTPHADFSDLLAFDFDRENPLALFNQILDAVEAFADQVDSLSGSSAILSKDLPIAGRSFDDIANQLRSVSDSAEALIANPSATLQNFEAELESGLGTVLGIPAAAQQEILDIALETNSPTAVVFDLSFGLCSVAGPGCSKVTGPVPVPFNLGLGDGFGGIVGAGATGNVNLNYAAKTRLAFGVDLPTVTPAADFGGLPTVSGVPQPFVVDTSNLSLTADALASGVFSASVGPLKLSIGKPDGTDDALGKVGARFLVDNDFGAAGATRIPIGSADFAAWVAGLPPTDISPAAKLGCPDVPGGDSYDACARLPVYKGADPAPLGIIRFSLAELENPGGASLTGVADVFDDLVAQGLDWSLIIQGMEQLQAMLDEALDGASFGQSVPVVGDSLDAGADISKQFHDRVVTPLNGFATDMQSATEPSQVKSKIETFFANAVGPLLVDRGPVDVVVTLTCNDGVNPAGPCDDAAHDAVHVADAQVAFSIGQTAATGSPIDFDIGMPGLRLEMKDDKNSAADDLKATLDWRIDLAFGLNIYESFYLVTNNPSPPPGTPAGSSEIKVGATLELPNNPLTGDVAFIPFSATDHDAGGPPPDLKLDLAFDYKGGGGDSRLSLSELFNGVDPASAPDFAASVAGGVHLAFNIETGALATDESSLPKFKTLFRLDWDFGAGENLQGDLGTGDLTIRFENVRIDLGSLLGGFLEPILGEAAKLTKPLMPVIDIVTAPIPGVTDLAQVVGCPSLPIPPTFDSLDTCKLSLLTLYELQNSELTMIRRLIQLIEFINTVDGATGNPAYPLGSFTVASTAARNGPLSANQKDQLLGAANGPGGPGSAIANALEGLAANIKEAVGKSKSTGGFTFPAFDKPERLFQMLLGKDVTLIHFDAGELEASVTIPLVLGPPIGPIPISVGITIQLGVRGHFAVGYDTKGMRRAVEFLTDENEDNDGVLDLVDSLFHGIGIDDRLRVEGEPTGEDIPEVTLFGSVVAKAAFDVWVAEMGIRGGVNANLRANLHDGGFPHGSEKPENLDGVLRIDEIITVLNNPLCLFDLDGEMTAFLEAYIDTLLGGEEFPIAGPVTVLKFEGLGDVCKETPKLAHMDGGTMVLNMGPYSGMRDFKEGEIHEAMTVRQLDAAGTRFSVTGFGFQEEHGNVSAIFADGGDGNDTIHMLPGSINTNGAGGDITEQIIPFTRGVTVCGGTDADSIQGGDGVDTLVGDGGKAGSGYTCKTDETPTDGGDNVAGGGGVDTIRGLGGGDRLNGDFGNDDIAGGTGVDAISGGPGADRANGGPGNDSVDGGPGADPGAVPAAPAASLDGGDTLMGGPGIDTIQGSFGDDTLYGEEELAGDFAARCAFDGGGAPGDGDRLDGGPGTDTVFGGSGPDDAAGSGGHDDICGNGGNDTLNGDGGAANGGPDGNDFVDGGAGDDVVRGAGGNDVVRGRSGADKGDGGPGDDDLVGGPGRDVMTGGDGTDVVVGDDATITGSSEAGVAARPGTPQALAALVTGVGTGTDATLLDCTAGGSGNTGTSDCLFGGGGSDAMFGEAGRDRMFGDDGDDWMLGGDDADQMRGGSNNDTMFGQAGADQMFGDSGGDDMFGNEGNDDMRGGLQGDCMEGNQDADTMNGDGGDDRMVGGSSTAGTPDGDDIMNGSTGSDVMAGDNAQMCGGALVLLDIPFAGSPAPSLDFSGADTMRGDDGADTIYGQSENDNLRGGAGGDYIEGNAGREVIHGDAGQDDLIGGSGHDKGGAGGAVRQLRNVVDDEEPVDGVDKGDELYGDGGADYLAGDNADIRRVGGLSLFDSDPATAGRSVELFEVQKVGGPAVDERTYGNDELFGGTGNDAMFGQGDADRIGGGAGNDYAEGNAASDEILGDAGRDDLIGGGSSNGGVIGPNTTGDGMLDDSDTIYGESDTSDGTADGDGGDAIAGDNARITALTDGTALPGLGRLVVLFDVEKVGGPVVPEDTHGPETLHGNSNDDFIFGQGDNDVIHGGAGNDYGEGNAGEDTLFGGTEEDDLLGGGSAIDGIIDPDRDGTGLFDEGDRIYGGDGADVEAGDNALIVRTRTEKGDDWETDPITQGHHRAVTLFDTARTAPESVSGNDLVLGGNQRDRAFGQGGNDTVKGNNDDDFIEGNQGGDLLEGNFGEDDIIGGSRTTASLDDGDIIHGGGDSDVAIGDNGVIDRVNLAPPAYYYETYQIGITSKRFIRLLDIDSADPLVAGSDQVSGGSQVDTLFGQGERDYVFGGTEDDYLEGNGGSDFEFGDLNRPDVEANPPPQLTGGLPQLPPGLPLENPGDLTPESAEPELSGTPGDHGQDDIIGGNSKEGLLDDGDFQYGNGAADFITGDNATLGRSIVNGAYPTYVDYNPTTFVRAVNRFCTTPAEALTCEAAGRFGGDYQEGNAGDDYMWGQDGPDYMLGGTENDDMYGELQNDKMFGEDGEDAMMGDRGGFTDKKLTNATPGVQDTTQGPTFFNYKGLYKDQLDRRADMTKDFGGGPLPHPGMTQGGDDHMRGGRGHDSMHGEFGDDVMNGDSGGDYMFGDDGGDVMWGGRGSDDPATPDIRHETGTPNAAQGILQDNLVDMLFGGYGGSATTSTGEFTGGSDIIDWRPRPGIDPAAWLEITSTDDDTADPATRFNNQHHQGVDWIYGGWDRDVLQGNLGKNGPDFQDRLLDWVGAYNLYSRCNASYGDDGDVRQFSPDAQKFIQNLAYGSGAGTSLANVANATTSGGREMALVYSKDAKFNQGPAYPTTPGHFDNPFCNEP